MFFLQFPISGWTTVFKQTGENTISTDDTITSFHRGKEWKISFEFQPTSLGSTRHILRCGSHDPGFQIKSNYKLRVYFSGSYQDFLDSPSMGKWSWTKLEYKQEKEGNSGYFITITMNDKIIYKGKNSSPKEESSIEVKINSSYQPGKIKSILIQNKDTELE